MASERDRRLTANWLAANAQIYAAPHRVQPDVLAALAASPSLRPKTEIYTYDDGRTQLLLCIHGTIPIVYRGATYNIPVAIWLTLSYPREPPIVYVVPAPDMLVRQSPYVDLSGRCDLEYMRNWRAKPDSCSVQALIDAMVDHFSSQPPLYARPRSQLDATTTTRGGSLSSLSSPPAVSTSPARLSLSSDHDRVAHVVSPPPLAGRASVPPPLPRKPPGGSFEGAAHNAVGLVQRPSPDHHLASPPSLSYTYTHGALPASQLPPSLPQTHISSSTPSAIPPHSQSPGQSNYPLQPSPAPYPTPATPGQSHSSVASPPNRPPPVPPLPAGIQATVYGQHARSGSTSASTSSALGSDAGPGSGQGASPPPYYFTPGARGREVEVYSIHQQQQQQQGHQIATSYQPQLQSQSQSQQAQLFQQQPHVSTPASPPPPPPPPAASSPFHVPPSRPLEARLQQQQQQQPQEQQRLAALGHAQGYGQHEYSTPTVVVQAPPQQAQAPQGFAASPVSVSIGGQQPAIPQQYTGPASAVVYSHSPAASIVLQQQQQQQPAIQPQAPRVPPPDLLSSDDDALATPPIASQNSIAPFPPRPPNPELQRLHASLHTLVRSSLQQLQASCSDAQQKQLELQRALLAGAPAIEDESARLVAVRDVCRGVSVRLRDVVGRAEGVVAEVRRRGEVEVDEMVCATSIVGNQLINLVAEDNAIEDTMYHLHRALNSGRIDLERFLRTTRVLAEEQFMKRALVEKIQKGLPMGMSMHA